MNFMHKTVVITGFDPFGGEPVNPAFQAVSLLPDAVVYGQGQQADVIKAEIPTSFTRSKQAVAELENHYHPDLFISVGQAGGRSAITVERVAINLEDARIPDNDGEEPHDQPVIQGDQTAYFSTLPDKNIVKSMNEQGIPAQLSYTAGTYVCNAVMYTLLALRQDEKRPERKLPHISGFIHVPYSTEQGRGKPEGTPTMPVDTMAQGLQTAIAVCLESLSIVQSRPGN